MTDQKKPTDAYELVHRMFRFFRASEHLTGVMNHIDEIGCDRELMKEYLEEVWSAIHDDAREWEDTIRKEENEKCCTKILTALKSGNHIRGNFALTDLMEFAR